MFLIKRIVKRNEGVYVELYPPTTNEDVENLSSRLSKELPRTDQILLPNQSGPRPLTDKWFETRLESGGIHMYPITGFEREFGKYVLTALRVYRTQDQAKYRRMFKRQNT